MICRRKIQKIGGSYYLNLPMVWVNNRKIIENLELEIGILDDGSLKVAPEVGSEVRSEEENAFLPCRKYIAREIVRKCLTGTNKITIQTKTIIPDAVRKDIIKFVRKLPSAEIIHESKSSITIQNFKYASIPTKQAVRRMYQLTHKIFEDWLNEKCADIGEYINEIDRFFIIVVMRIREFLKREIFPTSRDEQYFTPLEALDLRMLVEHIQRISKIINLNLKLLEGGALPPKVKEFGEKIKGVFQDAMTSFFESDSDQACRIWENSQQILDESDQLLKEFENETIHLIIYNLLRIADYAKRISDLVL